MNKSMIRFKSLEKCEKCFGVLTFLQLNRIFTQAFVMKSVSHFSRQIVPVADGFTRAFFVLKIMDRQAELIEIIKQANQELSALRDSETIGLHIDHIEKETKSFICPKCDAHLQFVVQLKVMGVRETIRGDVKDVLESRKKVFTVTEMEMLKQAESLGILNAFKAARTAVDNMAMPKDLDRYFLTFLQSATKVNTPQFALRTILPTEHRRGDLEAYQDVAVTCILSNGYFRAFLPNKLMNGGVVKPLNRVGNIKNETIDLETWIRTKNGYVLARSLMFHDLKKKQAGQFAIA